MDTPVTVQRVNKNLVVHTACSLLLTHLGVAGVVYMIFVEDDPPALPLLLIAAGVAWFFAARRMLRGR